MRPKEINPMRLHALALAVSLPAVGCLVVISVPAAGDSPAAAKQQAAKPKVQGFAQDRVREKLDRGLVVRLIEGGRVYVGWRLLADDPPHVAFNVYRRAGDAQPVKVNDVPVAKTTDLVAPVPKQEAEWSYFVRPVIDGREGPPSAAVSSAGESASLAYLPIQLGDRHTVQKAGIADLDGDGRLDFVLKQPGDNIDPYEKYWKPSPDTYKLEAYRHDGKLLWRHDLGWSIERGIWYSPYVVFDFDGDGRAEVAAKTGQGDPRDKDGRVRSGPEYATILDGPSGKPVARVDWPSREGFGDVLDRGYNLASRNQIGVAYLDGKTPCLIVARGTYSLMKVAAYEFHGGRLRELWRWDNSLEPKSFRGQGAHWMHSADVDGDGRDEVLLGSSVLDDDGAPLWTTGVGHPDHFYLGDIDPARPGLEIYYGIESRQKERNGMCLVEAATGKILWGHEGPTRHVHGQGMCSDIDARHPGCECYSADTDEKKAFAFARLRTCKGQVISEEKLEGFGARCVYWDADLQREVIRGNRITDYPKGDVPPKIEGSLVAVADVLGDWREEIITSLRGELRIYTTTIPATDRRVCLMQDPIYRIDVAHAAMGYYQVPMLSYDPATAAGAGSR
jgi:rhamnogalacturonan endolyase